MLIPLYWVPALHHVYPVFPDLRFEARVFSSKTTAIRVEVQKQNRVVHVPIIWPVDEVYGEKSNDVLRLLCDHFRCNLVSVVRFC